MDCRQFNIKVSHSNNRNTITTLDTIVFKPASKFDTNAVVWLFSDNSSTVGNTVQHNFQIAGNVLIKALFNNCICIQRLLITTPIITVDTVIIPDIEGESATITNMPISLSVPVQNGVYYYWKTPGHDSIYKGNEVVFTFRQPGEKIIQLYSNVDSQLIAIKKIKVYNAISPTPPQMAHIEKQITPQKTIINTCISEEDFRFHLLQIMAKQKNPTDILKYLCNQQHTPVLINDSQTGDLLEFCHQLYGKKKMQIQQITLIKGNNGCIQEVRMSVNKKKFINLF
ncbi:hypothetical protein ACE38W_05025 [Chitinophaga sp. Hz27]|uniref:hypothetical protein n=1 Tax=Chitinophaga sp. Hz27 TaxID=3347169 RepID=UPI0035DA3DF8